MGTWNGGVTFDDAWQMWADLEEVYGRQLEVKLTRPRRLASGQHYPALVFVTVDRVKGGVLKPLTRSCQIGGARGARTVPAALVRAMAELMHVIEEEHREAAAQASF